MITGVFPPDSGEIYIEEYNLLKHTLEAKMKMHNDKMQREDKKIAVSKKNKVTK
jgi:hypothetical protein